MGNPNKPNPTPAKKQEVAKKNFEHDVAVKVIEANKSPYRNLHKHLSQAERKLISQNPEGIDLSGAKGGIIFEIAEGIVKKLKAFLDIQDIAKRKDPNGAYMGDIDRAAALVKDKPSSEAGEFLKNYVIARYYLGKWQREGYLDQTEVNSYLPLTDRDPEKAREEIYRVTMADRALRAR